MAAITKVIHRVDPVREGTSRNGKPYSVQNVWIMLEGLELRAAYWNPPVAAEAGERVLVQPTRYADGLEATLIIE